MKKSFKGLLAAALAALTVGGLVACSNEEKPEEPKYEEKDFKFTGDNTLALLKYDANNELVMGQFGPATDQVKYACELNGTVADHKFTLKLTPAEEGRLTYNFSGKYEFSNGVGYKFTLSGSNTVVNTTFDEKTKEHIFVYNAPLGKFGNADITLKSKDEAFTISEEKLFLSNVLFGGGCFDGVTIGEGKDAKKGIIINNPQKPEAVGFSLQLYANGEFKFNNNHIDVLRQDGTYTFDKATKEFTFNFVDADQKTPVVAKSTFKDGIFTLPLEFNYQSKVWPDVQKVKVNMEFNANYYGGHGLTGIGYPMGSPFRVTLTLKNDEKHTAFIDGAPVDPIKGALAGMNLFQMFDKEATWKYDEATKAYTITYMDMVMGPNGQPAMENGRPKMIERNFTTKYDEATKTYSIDHFIVASFDATISGTDFGKDFTPAK